MKKHFTTIEQVRNDMEARKAACRILDVEENVDKVSLKKAYRRAALKYHPDHNGNTTETNRKFDLVKCAYEFLAFAKPCEKIVEDINSWSGVPEASKYRLDNPWGQFLWWKEKVFSSEKKNKENDNPSCI